MLSKEDKKRIWIFLGFAFGISWMTGLAVYLSGGLQNSPSITIGGTPLNLALVLLASFYMFGPAMANLFTRVITHEGKSDLFLEPSFDHHRWTYWLLAWFGPGILTLLGVAVFFICFPQYYDPHLSVLTQQLAASGAASSTHPWLIVVVQTGQAILLTPLLNAIPTFGEEFGWRGYLQPKLMRLGTRKAILLTGLIWGVWHWPVILMGYNYGSDYYGSPFLGPLAMVWFTLILGVFLGWLTIKSHNIWPAVIAHGALNGVASIGLLLVQGKPSSLLGPAPTGLIGGLGFVLVAFLIITFIKDEPQTNP
jgi:uncharacterized protein